MKKIGFLLILTIISILMLKCEDDNKVVGSLTHELKKMGAENNEILADGVSSTLIYATVYDDSGYVSGQKKVYFETNYGTIDEYVTTDNGGFAVAMLTSEASEKDLIAVVKATVIEEGQNSLPKITSNAYRVELKLSDIEIKKKNSLGKIQSATDKISVKFIGVTLKATIEDTLLSADGISQTKIKINLEQTTSGIPVSRAQIHLNSIHGNIARNTITDENGNAIVNLTAATLATEDTITVMFGNIASENNHAKQLVIRYVLPKLSLSAKNLKIPADGESIIEMVATLLTYKNTTISGATINFSSTAGKIIETATTNKYGQAIVELISTTTPDSNVCVTANFLSLKDSIKVGFVESESYSSRLTFNIDETPIYRDGIADKTLYIHASYNTTEPIKNAVVHLSTDIGTVPPMVITDLSGNASFKFVADANSQDATASIEASIGSIIAIQQVKLIGLTLSIYAQPDSIAADGKTSSEIKVELKETNTHLAVSNYKVAFSADRGTIPNNSDTDEQGVATGLYTADRDAGKAMISAYCGKIVKSIPVYLFDNYPTSINLTAEPNYIWVKETGNLEQTKITAEVLDINGQPIDDNIGVIFRIVSSPDGGEYIEPAGDSYNESSIVNTTNGKAHANIRAGIRSGTVQIQAELVDYSHIQAKTTNIVIRSGPAYMWVNPSDANEVIPHGTLACEVGKFNTAFGNPIQDIKITAYFADKYSNPVEENTAVYFTTTGGYITTDAITNEKGQAQVILQNAYPFPWLQTQDNNQITSCCIPNPNDENISLDERTVPLWDFENNIITNTMGTTDKNDGITVVLAYTWGQDQFGNEIKVWAPLNLIFSVGLNTFTAVSDKNSLKLGEYANILIRIYDDNGNPVAAGSSLIASTSAGKLSENFLMPAKDNYGYGTTFYHVSLVNNLNPLNDNATTAVVTLTLDSPNGSAMITVPIALTLER